MAKNGLLDDQERTECQPRYHLKCYILNIKFLPFIHEMFCSLSSLYHLAKGFLSNVILGCQTHPMSWPGSKPWCFFMGWIQHRQGGGSSCSRKGGCYSRVVEPIATGHAKLCWHSRCSSSSFPSGHRGRGFYGRPTGWLATQLPVAN